MVVQIGTCLVFALTTLCFPKTQKPKNLGALRSPVVPGHPHGLTHDGSQQRLTLPSQAPQPCRREPRGTGRRGDERRYTVPK